MRLNYTTVSFTNYFHRFHKNLQKKGITQVCVGFFPINLRIYGLESLNYCEL
jgi:hypothetical protein